jgi:hypothetical protein
MNTTSNTISVTYSDSKLRILVEEFITMQKHEFTFKDLCSYVLYWAEEEGKTATVGLYESNQLDAADCEKISVFLRKIINEGRIISDAVSFDDNTLFVNNKE